MKQQDKWNSKLLDNNKKKRTENFNISGLKMIHINFLIKPQPSQPVKITKKNLINDILLRYNILKNFVLHFFECM